MSVLSKILQDISFGDNLRKIRKKRGLTLEEVSAQMAIQGRPIVISTLSSIENGKRNMFTSDLIAIKRVLNTTYDEIFAGLEPLNRYDFIDE